MDLSRMAWRTFLIVLEMLALGGCVAMAATPITAPIWFLLGILFLISPSRRSPWAAYSVFMVIQFFLFAAFGFGSWIDFQNKGYILTPVMFRNTVGLGVISIILAATTWLTIRISQGEETSQTQRMVSFFVQMGIIIVELSIVGYLTFAPVGR